MSANEASRSLVVQVLPRDQDEPSGPPRRRDDGAVRTLLVERDDEWVRIGDDAIWLDDVGFLDERTKTGRPDQKGRVR